MKNISKAKVLELRIPERPINEQQVIVNQLDKLERKLMALHELQAATQAELEALLPAILDQAFRGSCRGGAGDNHWSQAVCKPAS